MRIILVLGLLVLVGNTWLSANEGEEVYKNKCASCHAPFVSMSELSENFFEQNNTLLNLKAPTLNQLSFRLKQQIGDPKGDKEIHMMEVSAFISEYVTTPNRERSLCLPEVMQFFETMPSMEGQITEEDLEEVSIYLYGYDQTMTEKLKPQYEDFDAAMKKAKDTDKIIMIKATAEHCHYCIKMDREVMIEEDVLNAIQKDFIAVEIDVSKQQAPLGIQVEGTPSFFFVDKSGKVIKSVFGSWNKEDFLVILNEAIEAKGTQK